MAGILEAGGSIDNLFDVIRSDIGKADTSIQEWFHDYLKQDTSRYDIQSVLYWYGDGIKNGRYSQFSGMNDPQAGAITIDITNCSGLNSQFVYNVLFGLLQTSKTDDASARILAGGGGNFFDTIMNAGITKGIADGVNDTLEALGLPNVATTVIIIIVVALIALIIYKKVK